MERICVCGIGNELRGDDLAGLQAARAVAALRLPGVEVREAGDDATALIDFWQDAKRAYVIDAVRSGRPAGAVQRFEAHQGSLPPAWSVSTHVIGLSELIELARALGKLPSVLVLYGIEGERFGAGEAPAPAVLAAAADVARRIAGEIGVAEARRA